MLLFRVSVKYNPSIKIQLVFTMMGLILHCVLIISLALHHVMTLLVPNSMTALTDLSPSSLLQELCRQRMAVKPPTERPEPISSRINSVSSQFSDGGPAVSPSARSSISSWSEEPAHSNMDISTGHMILVSFLLNHFIAIFTPNNHHGHHLKCS